MRLLELARAKIRVEAGPRLQDTFGRLLYYVYTDEGESIDEILASEGLARTWTRDSQHRDLLVQLEQEAQRKGIGCLFGEREERGGPQTARYVRLWTNPELPGRNQLPTGV